MLFPEFDIIVADHPFQNCTSLRGQRSNPRQVILHGICITISTRSPVVSEALAFV